MHDGDFVNSEYLSGVTAHSELIIEPGFVSVRVVWKLQINSTCF